MPRKEDWSLLLYLIPCSIFFSVPRTCAVNYTSDCSGGNYSGSSGIGDSLALLFSSLSSLSSSSNFANTTARDNSNPTVYGLFMCQGDLPHSDCHTCINSAIIDINQSCSNSRSGIIWYEFCELRYSDLNFFGIPVTEGHFTTNPYEETSSTKPYQVLSTLVQVAPSSKPLMFASNVSNMYPLFAQAQCSSDLSVQNCSVCLTTILATIKSCCVQRKGWRYFTPTCWVRYEPTPFFGNYPNATSPYIVRSQCAAYGFLSGEVSSKQASLRSLLSDLQSIAPATGFYNTSVGENSNRLFGLALCRGDLAAASRECGDCLATAGAAIVDECPNKTEGFMWYGQCFVKYSDQNFFDTLDNSNYTYCGKGMVSREIDQTTSAKARSLIPLAINNSLLFAADKVVINDTSSSYLLLQCTRDLTSGSCRLCLEIGISKVTDSCKQIKGWQYLSGSCTVRYETFPFYNETAAARLLELQPEEGRGSSSNVNAIAIALPIAGVAVLGVLLCCAWCMWRRRGSKGPKPVDLKTVQDRDLTFMDLDTIRVATNNFSNENKLGEGGFGAVYKGILVDGKEIAVKRLSQKSKQGISEFQNEVKLVAQLQHKNLVRVLGCCVEGEEKLLIYEYLSNRSLDVFLFDPINRESLSWERRFFIISGIAKGLLYLHEDSLLKVIHRDLKASNVLLDKDMNPKISDFGMAKIYNADESEVDTHRIVGTFGYMAPEYAMNGIFSVKSDVFSYGVLLLEIISGERNGRAYAEQHGQNLLIHAWELWNSNKASEFIDSLLANRYEDDEALKCIHIGLLCVQENIEERPTMSKVVLMLRGDNIALPQPAQPPNFIKKSSESENRQSSSMIPSSLHSINEVTESDTVPR